MFHLYLVESEASQTNHFQLKRQNVWKKDPGWWPYGPHTIKVLNLENSHWVGGLYGSQF